MIHNDEVKIWTGIELQKLINELPEPSYQSGCESFGKWEMYTGTFTQCVVKKLHNEIEHLENKIAKHISKEIKQFDNEM